MYLFNCVLFLAQAKVTEESSQYEFENYMRQQLMLAEGNTMHEVKSFAQKRQFSNIPPVRRLGHDAQPINPLDAAILAQRYLRKWRAETGRESPRAKFAAQ